ncbi:ATP-binding protein [Tsukamurella soli]|uniref:hypothetical protein n=1 Tax=Tsukamurella soli TaxID=644556 RepID=UPI0031E7BC3C
MADSTDRFTLRVGDSALLLGHALVTGPAGSGKSHLIRSMTVVADTRRGAIGRPPSLTAEQEREMADRLLAGESATASAARRVVAVRTPDSRWCSR